MLIYPGLKRFVFIDETILHTDTRTQTPKGVQGEIKVDDSYSCRHCCLTLDSTTLHTGIHPFHTYTHTSSETHTDTHLLSLGALF